MPEQFYTITPFELNTMVIAYTEHKREQYKNGITYAYYNAYFHRVEKMPKLADVLDNLERGDEGMTDEEMFRVMKARITGEGG